MQRVVLLSLFFISLIAGQDSVDQQLFKTTDAHYRLGKYEIVIRQHKRLKELSNQKEFDTHVGPVWCSAVVEIQENGRTINKIDFNNIWPLGWHYGIFFPIQQESPKHFIMVKYGDYNSRTLLITDEGMLVNLAGEAYRIFLDRYLIARGGMADDSHDFSFFDLHKNKLLFTVGWGDPIRVEQLRPRDDKAHIIKLYINEQDLFASIDIVNVHDLKTIEHTSHFYKIDLETGKIADVVFDEKRHTEFVIDTSNLDLSNDCECKKRVNKLS